MGSLNWCRQATAWALFAILVFELVIESNGQTERCSHEWQILAQLVPFYNIGTGAHESVEEVVAKSVGLSGDKLFEDEAVVRLTWVVSRRIGSHGWLQVDKRATAQAIGVGLLPEVQVEPFFWDKQSGATTRTLAEFWGAELERDSDNGGWSVDLRLSDISTFSPYSIRTRAKLRPAVGIIQVCTTVHIIRLPILELAGLTSSLPYVLLGGSPFDELIGSWSFSERPTDLIYGTDETWNRLRIEGVPGTSWIWFALAWRTSTDNTASVWASTNSWHGISDVSTVSLDLNFIYPFQSHRLSIDFEWDLDPYIDKAYEEIPEPDAYLDGAVLKNSVPWYQGPCPSTSLNDGWEPRIVSYGSSLVSSNTWGVAYKSLKNVSIQSPLVNYGWKTLVPLCSKIYVQEQLDPLSPGYTCNVVILPVSNNLTVPFDNETSYDRTVFEGLTLPTVFVASGYGGLCEEATTIINDTYVNQSTDSTSSQNMYYNVEELLDSDGLPMSAISQLAGADVSIVRGAVSLLPNGENTYFFLLESVEANQTVFRIISFREQEWNVEYTFPLAGVRNSSSSRRLDSPQENEDISSWESLELIGLKTTRIISTYIYAFGSALLLSVSSGKAFWSVSQEFLPHSAINVTVAVRESLRFHEDPVEQLVTSQDGWLAVLTRNRKLWIGSVGSNKIFYHRDSSIMRGELHEPVSIFFDEANQLRFMGLASFGEVDGLRTLSEAIVVNLNKIKTVLSTPSFPQSSESTCGMDALALFAPQRTSQIRELYRHDGFQTDELLGMQDSSFFNQLPERIFLDHSDEYSFRLSLQTDLSALLNLQRKSYFFEEGGYDVSILLSGFKLGFELSNQDLIGFEVERTADFAKNSVEYLVSIRDKGNWGKTVTENSNQVYRLPGEGLSLVTFSVSGLSEGCQGFAHPGSLATKNSASPRPLQLNIYSGCPPLREIVFDPILSKGPDNHGCTEREEEICLFYHHPFYPAFKLIDLVTGVEESVGGDFGDIFVVGGGPTFDTMVEYPEENRDTVSSQVITFETKSKIRWVCLVKSSPCYRVPPSFPDPPQYYFILELRSNSKSSYCDYSTRFVVRVHNLPITIETILVTNFATIGACLLPLLLYYNHKQQQIRKNLHRVQDVDVSMLQEHQMDVSESEDSLSESSLSDSDDR